MAKVAVGSIPQKITYVCASEKEVPVGCAWDISWHDHEDAPKTIKTKVLPTFPIDSSDKKAEKNAIDWAEQGEWKQDANGQWVKDTSKKASITETDNTLLSNIKVLSLETRGNGGRAYKAVIGNYYVDLREDVLMDTLLQAGIDAGGVLKGEFIWAKLGSQMKLVRVGSELHRLIVEFDSKKDLKPIGKADLEIGGVYQDRKKSRAVFVGYVNTFHFRNEDVIPPYSYPPKEYKPSFKFKHIPIKKAMLFYELPSWRSIKESLSKMKQDGREGNSYYCIKKSHTYLEKVDQVEIPHDLIAHLRSTNRTHMKNNILEYLGQKTPEKDFRAHTAKSLVDYLVYDAEWLNIWEYGSDKVEPFDIKLFLTFS